MHSSADLYNILARTVLCLSTTNPRPPLPLGKQTTNLAPYPMQRKGINKMSDNFF